MSTSGTNVEEPAYLKLMLHAAKYPWAAVGGFLLGVGAGDDKVVVKDAVPLFHSLTLSPLLETSATMVDAYAAKKGLAIVGYYQAHKLLESNTPSVLNGKIMEKIDARNSHASVLLVISNRKLEKAGEHALTAYARDTSGSFRRNIEVQVPSESVAAFEAALSRRAEASLVDMDDHLDDVSKDWRNLEIAAVQ